MAGNDARLENQRRGADLDKDDDGRRDGHRRGRMKDNAQRAMVRIAFERMHVRHLGHGQQRQKGQTQQGSGPESARLPAAGVAQMCLKSVQSGVPCFKDTQNWTREGEGGCLVLQLYLLPAVERRQKPGPEQAAEKP